MPPWKPEPAFGKFQHERRLSAEQIAPPEGNPKDKPQAPSFADGWQADEPNLVLKAGSLRTDLFLPRDPNGRSSAF